MSDEVEEFTWMDRMDRIMRRGGWSRMDCQSIFFRILWIVRIKSSYEYRQWHCVLRGRGRRVFLHSFVLLAV